MRDTDSYFSQASHVLYHYTSIGSLLKILENKKIYASHAYYLNDSDEIKHASKLISEVLVKFNDSRNENERKFIGQFSDWLQTVRQNAYGIFIFSLSEKKSLLSQWRSYTPHGKGISLGFSREFVDGLLLENDCKLAKCIYSYQEQINLATSLVEKIFISFRQEYNTEIIVKGPKNQEFHAFLEKFRGDLLQIFAIMKHSAFAEEEEWRIISKYYPEFKDPKIKFREGLSILVPYIELNFSESYSSGINIFEKVVMGPSQNINLSNHALSSYLSNQGACSVVLDSGIPFRKW